MHKVTSISLGKEPASRRLRFTALTRFPPRRERLPLLKHFV